MSRKLDGIPNIPNYDWIRNQMNEDLKYRLSSRKRKTSFGNPLYERINVQIVVTKECPYNCYFCIDKKNPMTGNQDFNEQIKSLKLILKEHPNARLTITGGEPSLYLEHIKQLIDIYKKESDNIFYNINTTGYDSKISKMFDNINLSSNECVKPNLKYFPNCNYQTVLSDDKMNLENIKDIIEKTKLESNNSINKFSFRYLSTTEKVDYNIDIFNELREDDEIKISTFRIGDFFVYATFDYKDTHNRITLGDLWQQQNNNYGDGYSNIIIHPNGKITTNWKD